MNFSHSDLIRLAHESRANLTVEQKELLVCLFEEAAEVTKVVAKILRFGYHSCNPEGVPNADLLQTEVADFLGIVDRLTDLAVFDAGQLELLAAVKLGKLENFLLCKGDTAIA